jgi:hypothetical protein
MAQIIFLEIGFRPHYINIATTRYNETAGATAQPSPNEKTKKGKKKLMPTCQIGENEDDPATVAPSGEVPPCS